MSPNDSLVLMSPVPGATVTAPSFTVHLAGPPLSTETHLLRSRPSNNTMASEGGSEGVVPGVTILGCGSHTSVDSGVRLSCCPKHAEHTKAIMTVRLSVRLIGLHCSSKIFSNLINFALPVFHHHAGDDQRTVFQYQTVL